MSKRNDLRGQAAPAPDGAGTPAGIRKRNAWWRRPKAALRPVTVSGSDGQALIGRRLPEAWVWVEADAVPGATAANDPAFDGGPKK